MHSTDELVTLMEQAFSAVDDVCSQLEGAQWDLPTDCPAWSVKDNLSHLAHFESVAVGMPQVPDPDVSHLPHIEHDFHRMTEVGVQARRRVAPTQILSEFREATALRIKQLNDTDEDGWSKTTASPVGEMPARDFLGIRILDVFYHEQDIRRAAGIPGHLNGAVARYVFDRMATRSIPRVIGKGAAAPDGSTVALKIPGHDIAYRTSDGRTAVVDAPTEPTVTIDCDLEAFFCLAGGRQTRAQLGERVAVTGDTELGTRIIDAMVVVP